MPEMRSQIRRRNSELFIILWDHADTFRRHLLRLWLRDPEYEWSIPEGLTERFANVYENIKVENQVFPLEPRIRSSSDGVTKEEKRAGQVD